MSEQKEPTVDEMRRLAAKVFFDDCKDDDDYPFTTWQEQYNEMVVGQTVTEEFLRFVWDANADYREAMNAHVN